MLGVSWTTAKAMPAGDFAEVVADLMRHVPNPPELASDIAAGIDALAAKYQQHAEVCLALDADKAVGLLAMYVNDLVTRVSFVSVLSVSPTHHRCGIGKSLMVAGIDRARELGMRRMTLKLMPGNVAARRLYESLGFTISATDGPKLVMARCLD